MTALTTSSTNPSSITIVGGSAVPAVRLDIVVPAGQAEQDCLLQAIFTNRLLREGTNRLSGDALSERLDHLGAWLELSTSVHHSFLTLYTLRRHADETFRLVADMLFHPTFPQDRFEVVRQANRSQHLVSLRRGDVVARRHFATAVYGPDHPCGRFAETADYDKLCRSDLVRFHAAHYLSTTPALFLSGDIDDDLVRLTEECLATHWKPFENKESSAPSSDCQPVSPKSGREVLTSESATQDSLRMGCLMMDVCDNDYHMMRIVTTALGGYFGSRLMRTIREERGLTYGIQAGLYTNTRQVLFVVSSEAAAGYGHDVADEVVRQCELLCAHPIPDDELRRIRAYMNGETLRNYESVYNLVDAHIFAHTHGLPSDHLQRAVEAVRTATPADLLAVARRWLRPDQFHTVIVTPQK